MIRFSVFILTYLISFCSLKVNAQFVSISDVSSHVKGLVFTYRFGWPHGDNITMSQVQSFGASLLIRPGKDGKPGPNYKQYPDTVYVPNVLLNSNAIQKKAVSKDDTITYCEDCIRYLNCIPDTGDANPFTLVLGYEYAPVFSYSNSEFESTAHIQLKGFYGGGFLNLKNKLVHWVGITGEICSISGSTATTRDSISGSFNAPVSFSSESIIAPEFYVGRSLSKENTFLSKIFIDLSYQFIGFHSITYTASNGDKIMSDQYKKLPQKINLNTFFITLGVSIYGNPFGGDK